MNNEPVTTIQATATRVPLAMDARGIRFDSIEVVYRFAQYVAESPWCPKGFKAGDVVVCIQHGMELGLKPTQALRGIMVVNGRPSVWGDTLKGIVEASQLCEYIDEWIDGEGDARTAYCETKKRNRPMAVTTSFSIRDARKAKLLNKPGPWQDYPDRMLQMRARAFCLRDAYPELLTGISVAEESMDIPADPVSESIDKRRDGVFAKLAPPPAQSDTVTPAASKPPSPAETTSRAAKPPQNASVAKAAPEPESEVESLPELDTVVVADDYPDDVPETQSVPASEPGVIDGGSSPEEIERRRTIILRWATNIKPASKRQQIIEEFGHTEVRGVSVFSWPASVVDDIFERALTAGYIKDE